MSEAIEMARKVAGISDMSKGYPKDVRQRGAWHWRRFVAAVGALAERAAYDQRKVRDENAELRQRLEALQSMVFDYERKLP